MQTRELTALYILSRTPGVGPVTASELLRRFGDGRAVLGASRSDLAAVPRVKETALDYLESVCPVEANEELQSLEESGISVLGKGLSGYPGNLAALRDAPVILFCRGALQPGDETAISIVGSRNPSPENYELAKNLASRLAERGFTIVSGLALGIDRAAHLGALEQGGRTLAALGSGLANIFPVENHELAQQISRRGALLTEYLPGVRAEGRRLMARNRLVTGLSLATLVVEAGEKSGSVDAGLRCLKQGRILWAVPGSPGADRLLREGAREFHSGQDLDLLVEPDSSQLGLF